MSKPRLLDLFCGAGGCSMGYHQAGFEVVGVDILPQPHYPFEFIQGDALTYPLDGFDVIHASPPCQAYTMMLRNQPEVQSKHADLVVPVRKKLMESGKPYVIENVVGAPLLNAIVLCGEMFGLQVYRHRLFESNCLLLQPTHRTHRAKVAPAGYRPKQDEYYPVYGHFANREGAKKAMGINWMETTRELALSIPPIYTEWIGNQIILYVDN